MPPSPSHQSRIWSQFVARDPPQVTRNKGSRIVQFLHSTNSDIFPTRSMFTHVTLTGVQRSSETVETDDLIHPGTESQIWAHNSISREFSAVHPSCRWAHVTLCTPLAGLPGALLLVRLYAALLAFETGAAAPWCHQSSLLSRWKTNISLVLRELFSNKAMIVRSENMVKRYDGKRLLALMTSELLECKWNCDRRGTY